jgi:hypothetical protein
MTVKTAKICNDCEKEITEEKIKYRCEDGYSDEIQYYCSEKCLRKNLLVECAECEEWMPKDSHTIKISKRNSENNSKIYLCSTQCYLDYSKREKENKKNEKKSEEKSKEKEDAIDTILGVIMTNITKETMNKIKNALREKEHEEKEEISLIEEYSTEEDE